jgi:acetoin utilization protein AcuB
MIVGMWMTRDPLAVSETLSISDAALEMSRRRVRRLLVVEAGHGRLLGIVSLKDLARAFPPDVNPYAIGEWQRRPNEPISQVMTRDPLTSTTDAPIEEAARTMLEQKIGALPVLSASGALIGIITESDIFRAFLEVIGGRGANVRVTFDLSAGESPLALIDRLAARHAAQVEAVLSFEHDGQRLGVVRLSAGDADGLIDGIWRSGHRVVSVQRLG